MFNFRRVTLDDAYDIFKWRRSSHVTEFMYTDIEDDFEKHKQWLKRTLEKSTEQYWIIYQNDIKIGVISLNGIDLKNSKASSGFYIGDLQYAMLSGRIFPFFLNYVFKKLELNKLVIEVMSSNINIKKMDLFYGFREVGVYKQHILKNNVFHDVDILELTQDDWNKNVKFHKYIADFE